MKKHWLKQHVQLGMALALLSVLLLLCIGVFQYMLAKSFYIETEDKFYEVLLQNRQLVRQNLQDAYHCLDSIGVLAGAEGQPEQSAAALLLAENRWHKSFAGIGAASLDGTIWYGAAPPAGTEKLLQAAMRGENQAQFLPAASLQQPEGSLFLAVPIWRAGKVTGAVYGLLSGEVLQQASSGPLFQGAGAYFCISNDFQAALIQPGSMALQETAQGFLQQDTEETRAFLQELRYSGRNLARFRWQDKDYYLSGCALPEFGDWYIAGIVPVEAIDHIMGRIKWSTSIAYTAFAVIFLLAFGVLVRTKWHNEAHIRQLAYTDQLTKLANWDGMVQACRAAAGWCLVVLDFRAFSEINEFMGHAYGTKLLLLVTDVLRQNLEAEEMACRINSDRFVLYMRDSNTLSGRLSGILYIIRQGATGYPVHLDCGMRRLADGMDMVTALGDAVTALKLAKHHKEDAVVCYNKQIGQQNIRQKTLAQDLENALKQQEMVIYLQPKYDLRENRWCGSEALVRWKHPTQGILPPGAFVQRMEEDGTIDALDCYMLEAVCRQIRRWLDAGREVLPISVNISRVHFANQALVSDILAIVQRYDIPKALLELEVTESAFFKQDEVIVQKLQRLHQEGFQLSIDDFGVGYSTLSALEKIPASILKLDKSFVNNWMANQQSCLVADIVQIARHIGLKVVIEVVETAEQCDMARAAGCDVVQGWYYAKAVAVDEYERMIYGSRADEKTTD